MPAVSAPWRLGLRTSIRGSSAAIFKIPSPLKPIYDGQTALEHGKGETGKEDRGQRAIDADRQQPAAAFLGNGNGNGTGRTVSGGHAAILRYEIQAIRRRSGQPAHIMLLPAFRKADLSGASAPRP